MSSGAVMADAQFGTARVVKPFAGFEEVYQGLPGDTPICFPGVLDSLAGKPGYDPNLLAGIPVPLGSKAFVWFPSVFGGGSGGGGNFISYPYRYEIRWRLRNLADFRTNRAAYHFPKQSLGFGGQYVIPASNNVILFEGARAASVVQATSVTNETAASVEGLTFPTSSGLPPKTPSGSDAAIEQGLGPSNGPAANTNAAYNCIEFDCRGDEMLIFVTKTDGQPWEFTPGALADFPFSQFYGDGSGEILPDLGIYVLTGSNP